MVVFLLLFDLVFFIICAGIAIYLKKFSNNSNNSPKVDLSNFKRGKTKFNDNEPDMPWDKGEYVDYEETHND